MLQVATKPRLSKTEGLTGAVAFADSSVVAMIVLATQKGATCLGCTNPACADCVARRERFHERYPHVLGFFDRRDVETTAEWLQARGFETLCGKPRGYNVPYVLLTNYSSPELAKLPKLQKVGIRPGGGAR